MNIYSMTAMALYYFSKHFYFKEKEINGYPWPPSKKMICNIIIKTIIIIQKLFYRKTAKRLIHPQRFKGWKGGR